MDEPPTAMPIRGMKNTGEMRKGGSRGVCGQRLLYSTLSPVDCWEFPERIDACIFYRRHSNFSILNPQLAETAANLPPSVGRRSSSRADEQTSSFLVLTLAPLCATPTGVHPMMECRIRAIIFIRYADIHTGGIAVTRYDLLSESVNSHLCSNFRICAI